MSYTVHLEICTCSLKHPWWHYERDFSSSVSWRLHLLSTLLFSVPLQTEAAASVTLSGGEVEAAGLTHMEVSQGHVCSRWTGSVHAGCLCVFCVCVWGLRGMGTSPEGYGINMCLRYISTCQPAEARERTDSLWRLASTPTTTDARHTRLSARTHITARRQMLGCRTASKYAINDSCTCHTLTYGGAS